MKLRVHFGDYASEDKVKFDDLPSSTDVKNVNINSNENLKTMFSKIKAVIGGLKKVAFTNSYNDLIDKLKIATNLTTDDDSQVLSAKQGKILNDELTSTKKSVSDGKKDVAAAITAKGVSVTSTDANPATFATLVTKINAITAVITISANDAIAKIGTTTVTKSNIGTAISGTKNPGTSETTLATAGTLLYCSSDLKVGSVGGNASASDVLTGKTFSSNTAGRSASGTMANKGAVTASVNCGGTYTIPAGYHNGSGKVTGNSLSSQTSATAAAGDILSDKTAYVNGSKVTGTMTNRGAVSATVNCGGKYTVPAGYHNGTGKVTGKSLSSQTGVDNGKTAAGASHILTGYQAWVNGNKVTGTMANKGAVTASVNCGGSYTIPAGYHNGSGKVTGNSLSSQITASTVYDKFKLSTKALATIPRDVTSANCIIDGTDYIYLIGGNVGKQATRYNIADNTYSTLASPPENIAYNSAVKLGQYIVCLGENHMLIYSIPANTWKTDATLSSEVKGGSVILSRALYIFNSAYVFQYNVIGSSSGTFSSSPISISQSACSSKNTSLRQVGLCNDIITSFGESNTIRTVSATTIAGSTTKATLTGTLFGGVAIIPNYKAILTCVKNTWENYVCNLETYSLSVFTSSISFYTAAVCTVGDDVYVFGSGAASDKYKATIIHTEEFLRRHY